MINRFFAILLLLTAAGASLTAQLRLNGAGATFPYVIYSKWFDVYYHKTGVQINYQSIGSGGGIKQVIEGTVDFGATDGPMSDEQLADARTKRKTDILHIPTVLGAVAVAYNLPVEAKHIQLTPTTLADIFLGKITKWNDWRIAEHNPGVSLPNRPIIVAHRSDGSGTTFIFTEYLAKVSSAWEKNVGRGTSVNWPIGLGGKGNEGVAGLLKQTVGSIGYVELAYAVKNNIPYAAIQNKAGVFVAPTISSITAAAAGASRNLPEDLRVSITNPDGKESYPISGFTWILVYKNPQDAKSGAAITQFLKWALSEGQSYAADLLYAPLPKEVVAKCLQQVDSIGK